MNRLGFGDFHRKHFSPEQQQYWQSILFQQPPQAYDYNTGYDDQTYYEEDQAGDADQHESEELTDHQLSKEAIEILEFSEAYRKERERERLEVEKEEAKEMEGWQYDESSVLVSGGVEAPATSLVLTRPRSTSESEIRIKEDLLNSAYLASCSNHQDSSLVLWPVVPLKL